MNVNYLLQQNYHQPAATFDQQIDVLKSRKLVIEDEEAAKKALHRIGYYRFRNYSKHWLDKSGVEEYKEVATFNRIISLCNFDCELRQYLLYIISSIEISLRAILSNEIANNFGPLGYLDSRNFEKQEDHWLFIDEIEKELSRTHDKFDSFPNDMIPIWAIIEIVNFSSLSILYKNLSMQLREKIAQYYFNMPRNYLGNNSCITLEKWLHCLTVYRNICAHNGKIYNRISTISPKLNVKYDVNGSIDRTKLFAIIIILKELSTDNVFSKFRINFEQLLDEYRAVLDLQMLGLPNDWEQILLL